MIYPHKPFLEGLFIFALFLCPITRAAADELPQQVNQLQTQMMATNERIATLASEQQRNAGTISALQADLNTTHQAISALKKCGVSNDNQSVVTNTGTVKRVANGHGR